MPGRRSVSVEPEDLVIASPRRRSARIAIRTDSPAPALKKELAADKSSTPLKRTRRSLSIQEKSLNDIEKDVNAISHHLNSRTASSSSASEQITGAARRTRRSASTQETHVLPDDLKKDEKPMPLKRSKRLLSKEKSADVIEEEDNKPEPTDNDDDDAPAELNATSARKRLTRSMSRSPTNAQKSKTSVPPVVKTFRNRLSTSDKNLEETKPAILDIITENEDEADKNEHDTSKPTLETDMLNNNAKKFSGDINMQTDEPTEDSASKSNLPAVSAADEIIKNVGTESEVQSSTLKLKNEETVLNTSVKSTTVEEINITLNPTNMDIADKSVTEKLLPNNDQNALNEKNTELIIVAIDSAENMKDPESSDKLDDSIKESVSTEEDINISNKELNDVNNCDASVNELEAEKESTVDKINLVLEKKDNSDLKVNTEIIDDSDPKEKGENVKTDEYENDNQIGSTEETIDKLEITQEEEMMDKLEINEESEDCKDNKSISEKSIIDTMSTNTNENKNKSKIAECNDSAKNESHEETYEHNEKLVAELTEISNASVENITKGEKETTKIVEEIEVTQNKVNVSELVEGNKDPGNENSIQIEIAHGILPEQDNSSNSVQKLDVVEVHSGEEQTNLKTMQQSVSLDNSVVEQRIETEVSPKKIKENLEITNTNDLKINSEPDNKDASISNNITTEIQEKENDKTSIEDDLTNISIVSADKTHTTVDKCENEENCETNISIVDSPDSNISSTPIKDTSIEKSDSAKKDHERNLNLSLVNDDGKSYSPIINRIENISVDFEYSTSSIVDSSGTALQEMDVLTKNETNSSGDDVELVTKDSCQEQYETIFQEKSENSTKSNNEIPKESKISSESLESNEKELNNSIKEVNQNDDSSNENIKEDDILNKSNKVNKNDNTSNKNIEEDEILNKSNRNKKNKVLDTSSDENIDSNEEIEKIDLTKSESPKKENNESSMNKAKESDVESTDKSRDNYIECIKADKKRKSNLKRQSSDDSIAESALKQKKRRKHKTDLNFSSESDENNDIEELKSRNRKTTKYNISDESEDEESDEYEGNEFIDDMASEGSEQTPSIDSNEIIDEGESVGSTDSQIDSDDDYEHGSFIVDDDVGNEELLSGSEDIECWTPKRKRIITIASDSDDELEKMSMEPFGGSSPSLISINQISSVDSDFESIKSKNEELSKLIEDKTKSDTEDVDNEDVIIVNESINKTESHVMLKNKSTIEELPESSSKHKEENIEVIDKIQQPVEEIKDAISIKEDTVNELEETESSLIVPMNELNTVKEKEILVETIENPDITQELIVENKSADKSPNEKEIIEEVIEPETEICNDVENNVEKESDNINSVSTQEIQNKEKDAKYQAILDKYFKHFDNKISKITRRRTTGIFPNENNDDANKDTTKRKRRQSLDTGEKKSQNDIDTGMFEAFYNESKKAKIPINDDDNEENMIDMKKEETEPKKTNSKVKKLTTDENDHGGISDAVEQKCKKTLKSAKRHSLTNIENIPVKYAQSPRELSKSFSSYRSSKEIEIIQKYIEIDNTESAASMLKDFSDTVKDDIKAAKASVLSPKKKKSRKSYDASELNGSGILVESLNNTSDVEKTKPSPKKPLLVISPVEKDCKTLKRKKKHSKSVDTLVQEELPTSEFIDTKEIEEVYTKTKKKKKQIKLETNDDKDKDNLEIKVTTKNQTKNTGDIKKSKQSIKLPTTASVSEINAEETGNEIKQNYKHSNFSKKYARASVDVPTYSSVDYLNDVSENTGVKLTDQNMINKKPKQMTISKSFPKNKNKNRSSPDNKFVVEKQHAIASKSEYDVINEYVSRKINFYKSLIKPSGRGTTGGNIQIENFHTASIKIKRQKKKQKYNRSSTPNIPMPKASFAGQTNCCNFKEEFLYGNNVKRVALYDILQKKRGAK